MKKVEYPQDEELAFLHAWKKASETLFYGINNDLLNQTGISGSDYGILYRIIQEGKGSFLQNEIAASLQWERSRLSHFLQRMQARGLIKRTAINKRSNLISITPLGKKIFTRAKPLVKISIRDRLLSKMTERERNTFIQIFEKIIAEDAAIGDPPCNRNKKLQP